jgi:multidrug efflux pump subunit AcrA (membrane-fusion protein)
MGFWIAALTAIPLFPGAGYHWLAHYLDQPQLRERALRLFFGLRRKGRPAPAPATGREKWGLLFLGVGTIVCCGALVAGGFLYLGVSLEQEFRGTGVALFFGVFTVAVLWLLALRAGVSRLRAEVSRHGGALPAGAGESAGAAVVPLRPGFGATRFAPGHHLRDRAQGHAPARSYRPLAIWALILAALAGVGMIPYSYDAGGQFTVLPNTRYEVRARVSGELIDIRVDEGDKVSANQILAVVSQWQQQRDLSVARANLEKAEANLRTLLESPKPEEVALALKQVESAAARVPFTKAQFSRQATLVKSDATSARNYDQAKSDYDQAVTALSVAKANYELVKTGPMPSEIEAARAEVKSLTEEVKFREGELERTFLRADKSGTVVTQKLRYLKGKYLKEGDLFAEIEDHAVARSDIDVPETDVPEVRLGSTVRLKSWALSEDPRTGTVVAIAPLAEDRGYGRVVRVSTDIPNADGLLRPGMTGYAKIEGPEMPLWRAYTRMFMRFFLVEVWSWIP